MELNAQIAQSIVKRAMKIIGASVNVMNSEGVIIASGNPQRLHQKHTGAVLALRENKVVEIDETLARQWNFEAQPGINLPIYYQGKALGVVGISGVPEQVHRYAQLVKMTAELIIEQHHLLEKERWQQRYKEEFILQLIKGNLSEKELHQQATFFDFHFEEPHLAIIIQLNTPNAENLQELVNHLESLPFLQDVVVASLDRVVILQELEQFNLLKKQLRNLIPAHFRLQDYKIAVGHNIDAPLAQQIHLSYRSAESALNHGQKCFPKKTIYFFEQFRLPALFDVLADTWQATELFKTLQPLYQPNQQILQKTLKQYFLSNCDLALTSEKLFVHPNTLRYRLNKIEQLTGLSFNNITDKFTLYLSTFLSR